MKTTLEQQIAAYLENIQDPQDSDSKETLKGHTKTLSIALFTAAKIKDQNLFNQVYDRIHLYLDKFTQDEDKPFKLWMLGRVLVACHDIKDETKKEENKTKLREGLDAQLVIEFKKNGTSDVQTGWALAYLKGSSVDNVSDEYEQRLDAYLNLQKAIYEKNKSADNLSAYLWTVAMQAYAARESQQKEKAKDLLNHLKLPGKGNVLEKLKSMSDSDYKLWLVFFLKLTAENIEDQSMVKQLDEYISELITVGREKTGLSALDIMLYNARCNNVNIASPAKHLSIWDFDLTWTKKHTFKDPSSFKPDTNLKANLPVSHEENAIAAIATFHNKPGYITGYVEKVLDKKLSLPQRLDFSLASLKKAGLLDKKIVANLSEDETIFSLFIYYVEGHNKPFIISTIYGDSRFNSHLSFLKKNGCKNLQIKAIKYYLEKEGSLKKEATCNFYDDDEKNVEAASDKAMQVNAHHVTKGGDEFKLVNDKVEEALQQDEALQVEKADISLLDLTDETTLDNVLGKLKTISPNITHLRLHKAFQNETTVILRALPQSSQVTEIAFDEPYSEEGSEQRQEGFFKKTKNLEKGQAKISLVREQHQHAVFLIETGKNENYKVQKVHLRGDLVVRDPLRILKGHFFWGLHYRKGKVEIKDLTQKKIKVEETLNAWEVSEKAATHLVKQVGSGIDKKHYFNLLGEGAASSSFMAALFNQHSHNCFTWARETLLLAGIHLKVHSHVQELTATNKEAQRLQVETMDAKAMSRLAKGDYHQAISRHYPKTHEAATEEKPYVSPNELVWRVTKGPAEFILGEYSPFMLACAYGQQQTARKFVMDYQANPYRNVKSRFCFGLLGRYSSFDCATSLLFRPYASSSMQKAVSILLKTQEHKILVENALDDYIKRRENEEKYKATFFGRSVSMGYTKEEKLAAARAFKDALENENNEQTILKEHKGALTNGELGKLFADCKRYCKEGSAIRFVKPAVKLGPANA